MALYKGSVQIAGGGSKPGIDPSVLSDYAVLAGGNSISGHNTISSLAAMNELPTDASLEDKSLIMTGTDGSYNVNYSTLMNAIYPVGSIYTTISREFKPADAFGGTWQKIASGRCLWGADADGSNVSSEISAGLPKPSVSDSGHSHGVPIAYDAPRGTDNYTYSGSSTTTLDTTTGYAQIFVAADDIYGKSETVLPPAFTVIFWLRIA